MIESIYYKSPVGDLKISGNDTSIRELLFVDTNKNGSIENNSRAYLIPTSIVLKNCITQMDDYFSGRNLKFDLTLLQRGTSFQQQVWSELINIPAGQTISYLQLSKNLGNVKAIRAVGTANGKNNIAIIVPCHRVIGSNGDLVGYAGDLWRKKWLLAHEAKYVNGVQSLFG
ncbi:MAG TPA: methylated-DNA--[protein]-cysteine S-methyltransferase [Ferruginibacter sp.]|nr:methylated-DNA--[protein]-cysteine S-methyltransferase [Ferruginibacter sp.]